MVFHNRPYIKQLIRERGLYSIRQNSEAAYRPLIYFYLNFLCHRFSFPCGGGKNQLKINNFRLIIFFTIITHNTWIIVMVLQQYISINFFIQCKALWTKMFAVCALNQYASCITHFWHTGHFFTSIIPLWMENIIFIVIIIISVSFPIFNFFKEVENISWQKKINKKN